MSIEESKEASDQGDLSDIFDELEASSSKEGKKQIIGTFGMTIRPPVPVAQAFNDLYPVRTRNKVITDLLICAIRLKRAQGTSDYQQRVEHAYDAFLRSTAPMPERKREQPKIISAAEREHDRLLDSRRARIHAFLTSWGKVFGKPWTEIAEILSSPDFLSKYPALYAEGETKELLKRINAEAQKRVKKLPKNPHQHPDIPQPEWAQRITEAAKNPESD